MKGIILAGGAGTRLYPLTSVTTKQLLPVYDKPMIYYPLSVLMLAGIREIMIISTPEDIERFRQLLGTGEKIGIQLQYAIQEKPEGIAQAFLIAEDFLENQPCALILGDNIFYGSGMTELLKQGEINAKEGFATVYGCYVKEPQRFGIMELDENNNVVSVEEKPEKPKSNYCITGLYFYGARVTEFVKQIEPSARGELEITTLNGMYLERNRLRAELLGRGFAWIDAGTVESLAEASDFVRMVEMRQNVMIAALEEIAYRNDWITRSELKRIAEIYGNTNYGKHLKNVANDIFRF